MNLGEDDLQELPEGVRFLKPLVACDVVVAAAEPEEKRIGRRLELFKARFLNVFIAASLAWDVGGFFEDDVAVDLDSPVAIPFKPVSLHAVCDVRAG